MPSAMVAMRSNAIGRPAANDSGYAAARSAWTPTIRTSG